MNWTLGSDNVFPVRVADELDRLADDLAVDPGSCQTCVPGWRSLAQYFREVGMRDKFIRAISAFEDNDSCLALWMEDWIWELAFCERSPKLGPSDFLPEMLDSVVQIALLTAADRDGD